MGLPDFSTTKDRWTKLERYSGVLSWSSIGTHDVFNYDGSGEILALGIGTGSITFPLVENDYTLTYIDGVNVPDSPWIYMLIWEGETDPNWYYLTRYIPGIRARKYIKKPIPFYYNLNIKYTTTTVNTVQLEYYILIGAF